MTIILIGYMGSGKSTIGQNLSKVLKFDWIDLDSYIQDKEGKSITDVFKTNGEIYFRHLESRYLQEVLSLDNTVISLGGGTPCYGNNLRDILSASHAKSIYLKLSIHNLVERLFDEKAKRPLIAHLKNKEALTEFIGKHLFERSHYYNKADFTITSDKKSVSDIVEEIVLELF